MVVRAAARVGDALGGRLSLSGTAEGGVFELELDGEALRAAVVEPARAFGVSLESEEMTERVVRELAGRRGALPLLQLVGARPNKTPHGTVYVPEFKMEGWVERPADLPEPPAPAPLLQVQNVIRDYRLPRTQLFAQPGHFRAVNDVSFTVPETSEITIHLGSAKQSPGKP